ncbi:MAG: 23S rRNA pseudouridine2605 synthase [Gammaproteobacteria bacterium]|jgi:23S rRNA pseudouridine2605 synthase
MSEKIMPEKKMPERIQKVLARMGLGSRREIESWIKQGRITVGGKLAKLGDSITTEDRVQLDKKQIKFPKKADTKTKVIAYHKPAGEICTRKDAEGRPTVFSKLPRLKGSRWIGIGRLDINTYGLLLFTNDGDLANRLMHPSSGVDREYAVRVVGKVDQEMLDRLQSGVELEDGPAHFSDIVDSGGDGANHWYHVTLMEGRNHEVKRLWESQGITVSRLIRVRFGPAVLSRSSRVGTIRELDDREINELYEWLNIKPETSSVSRHKRVSKPSVRKKSPGRTPKGR